jgi:hypothetical protein
VEPGASGAPLGAFTIGVDGEDPQVRDDAGSPLCESVMHGAGLGSSGATLAEREAQERVSRVRGGDRQGASHL